MAAEWTTNVLQVSIRAAGDVYGFVDVSNAGTREAIVSLTIGTTLCRITSRRTARIIRESWETAGVNSAKLPERVSQTWLGPDLGVNPVGALVRYAGDVVVTSHYVDRDQQLRRPAHLRIQVGPMAWAVLDRAAYATMLDLWRRAERSFG